MLLLRNKLIKYRIKNEAFNKTQMNKRLNELIENDKLKEALNVLKASKLFKAVETELIQISSQLTRLEKAKSQIDSREYNSNRNEITSSILLLIDKIKIENKKNKSFKNLFREKYLYGFITDLTIELLRSNSERQFNISNIVSSKNIKSRKVLLDVLYDLESLEIVESIKEENRKFYKITKKGINFKIK